MNNFRHHLRIRIVSLGISFAVLVACCGMVSAKPQIAGSRNTIRLNREFKLSAGQRVTLRGTNLRIKFVAVENDSRCPKDVTCVWAGNAAVRLQVSNGRRSKSLTLNTTSSSSSGGEDEFQGYKLKLVDVSPYPRSNRKIAPRDYMVTLLITRE